MPRFLADPTWGTLTFWVPLYLNTVRGFDLKQIALFAWLPFLAADLGCMFGGVVSLWLQKRGVSLINARRGAFTVGALLMTGMAFVGFVQQSLRGDRAALPRRLRAPDAVGHGHHDVVRPVPRNEVATVAGMAGTCGNAGVLVFSLLIGGLVATHRLHAVLRLPRRARSRRRAGAVDAGARAAAATSRRPRQCPNDCGASMPMPSAIRNPILRGFNPDPSIVRVGDDYYIATSTFEWFPGVQIHHSRDLVNWRLLTRPLRRAEPARTCSAIPIRAASGRRV